MFLQVNLVGLCIFTNKRYEDVQPSTHNLNVPRVTRKDFQVRLDGVFVAVLGRVWTSCASTSSAKRGELYLYR